MTSTTREGVQSIEIATAIVDGAGVRIVRLRLSVVSSMVQRWNVSFDGVGTAISQDRYARVRSAIVRSGFPFPNGFIGTTLLEDEHDREEATHDLPIAIGLLALQGVVPRDAVSDIAAVGEVSFGGDVLHCRGIIAVAAEAACFPPRPILVVPESTIEEARIVDRTHSVGISHLREIGALLGGTPFVPRSSGERGELADVKGLALAKRALTIAAAGGHHLLLVGRPGSGRTMLVRRLVDLLPDLTREEAIEVTAIHSLAGQLPSGSGYVAARPFRAPHHTVSTVGMVGGGRRPFGGEIILAHRGVLYLDDATEFPSRILESVGITLSLGRVDSVHQGPGSMAALHATVICVASMHPCPCGFRGSESRTCLCSDEAVRHHWRRLAPLVGHIDLKADLSLPEDETSAAADESSAVVRERVTAARERQLRREPWLAGCLRTNGQLDASQLTPLGSSEAIDSVKGESRASVAVLRVARTVADLAGSELVKMEHVQEARRYQPSWP